MHMLAPNINTNVGTGSPPFHISCDYARRNRPETFLTLQLWCQYPYYLGELERTVNSARCKGAPHCVDSHWLPNQKRRAGWPGVAFHYLLLVYFSLPGFGEPDPPVLLHLARVAKTFA